MEEEKDDNMFENHSKQHLDHAEGPEPTNFVKPEDPNWRPVKYRIENGKKIIILGDFEMTAEEFIKMVRSTLTQKELDEVEQGRFKASPGEELQRVE